MTSNYYDHPSYSAETNIVYLYCDGSQVNNGKAGGGRCGYGVFVPKTQHNEEYFSAVLIDPTVDKCTNNVAELLAMTNALNYVARNGRSSVKYVVVYDSTYAAGVITGTMQSKTNTKYVAGGQAALACTRDRGLVVEFLHTYGHSRSGTLHSIGNDVADNLANGTMQSN